MRFSKTQVLRLLKQAVREYDQVQFCAMADMAMEMGLDQEIEKAHRKLQGRMEELLEIRRTDAHWAESDLFWEIWGMVQRKLVYTQYITSGLREIKQTGSTTVCDVYL